MKLYTYKPNKQGEYEQVFMKVDSLPAYFKSAAHNIKIISETKSIWVTNDISIQTDMDAIYLICGTGMYEPSTPEQFNKAYTNAIRHIKNLNK